MSKVKKTEPVDKSIVAEQSKEENKRRQPEKKKFKWPLTRDENFKLIPIIISVGTAFLAFLAFQNTQRTIQANLNQFEGSNRPFIEVTGVKVDSVAYDKKPVLTCQMSNRGRFPTQVFSSKSNMGFADWRIPNDAIINGFQEGLEKSGEYLGIVPFAPGFQILHENVVVPCSNARIDSLRAGTLLLLYFIEIKYRNLQTQAPYYFNQILRINCGTGSVETIKYVDSAIAKETP